MDTGIWSETDIGGPPDIGAVLPMQRRIGWRPIMTESDFLKAIGTASAAAASTTTIGIATVTATSIMITIAGNLLKRVL
jgi:hypothetical protein